MSTRDSTGDTPDTHDDRETTALDLIEEQAEASIRRVWHDERWFFSTTDVIGLLTDAPKLRPMRLSPECIGRI